VLAAAALEENVARLLAGKRVVKQIYVPGRIVNFVVVDAA
jgi:leucyl-tRNA synthetase